MSACTGPRSEARRMAHEFTPGDRVRTTAGWHGTVLRIRLDARGRAVAYVATDHDGATAVYMAATLVRA
jgi:preprotein translocase subunit YajC